MPVPLHAAPYDTLRGSSLFIVRNVLKALQDADELGGPEEPRDYVALMNFLLLEILARRQNCIDINELAGQQFPRVPDDWDGLFFDQIDREKEPR